ITRMGKRAMGDISTMHQPSIQITPARVKAPKFKLKVQKKRINVSSNTTSSSPRLSRNFDSAGRLFTFCPYRNALVPARKTKAGTQKWVTQRVKKMPGSGPPEGMPEYTRT